MIALGQSVNACEWRSISWALCVSDQAQTVFRKATQRGRPEVPVYATYCRLLRSLFCWMTSPALSCFQLCRLSTTVHRRPRNHRNHRILHKRWVLLSPVTSNLRKKLNSPNGKITDLIRVSGFMQHVSREIPIFDAACRSRTTRSR